MDPAPSGTISAQQRLLSLDVFRGFTIAAMILVNDPGSWEHVYAPLLHAEWNGVTPTDLIFPFFLFIVGVSIAFAYAKRLQLGSDKGAMVRKILRRSATIFLLGIFLNLFPDFNFAEVRIPGVLQRIALVFLACALLFLYTGWRAQARIGAALLIAYWLMMTLIPTPGYGEVMLEPGKNLAAWIDSILIPGAMWQGTWDPEGILSTLPSIATGISGMLAGHLLLSRLDQSRKLIWLFALGFLSYVLGCVWDWVFPINKNLWTSSYVLYSSGLAALTLATMLWFVDALGYRQWTYPGKVFGTNAIAAYVLHGMLIYLFFIPMGAGGPSINSWFFQGLTGLGLAPRFVSLLWALIYVGICFIPIWILYQRRIFIKI